MINTLILRQMNFTLLIVHSIGQNCLKLQDDPLKWTVMVTEWFTVLQEKQLDKRRQTN